MKQSTGSEITSSAASTSSSTSDASPHATTAEPNTSSHSSTSPQSHYGCVECGFVLDAYGRYSHGKSTRDNAERVYRDLTRTAFDGEAWRVSQHARPLLVDEYQTLEATALRELLNIAEECRIPLVLCGNGERLAKERRNERPALDQIWNRVRPTYRIDPPDAEDCRAIAIEFNVEFDRATYAAVAAYGGRTSVRDLACLLDEARAIAITGPIKFHHIETAVMTIHGGHSALKLLSTSPST